MERWPNQIRAFDGTIDAIGRGVKRLCVTSPTGTGKTAMMIEILEWCKANSKTVVLYCQRQMLFAQTCRTLEEHGIDFGQRASGYKPALLRAVQVAMFQTEVSRNRNEEYELHPADVVLVDEAHQTGGPTYQAILEEHEDAGVTIIGYTATPLDLVGYDELLIAGRNSECRDCGALVMAETFAPDEPDLRHIKKYKVGEDISDKDNYKAIMRPGVFGRVFQAWQEHNPEQRPTILFGPDVAGSLFFAQEFFKHGIRSAHIDGTDCWMDGESYNSNPEARDEIMQLSKSGEVKVICNRFVLREGINAPWIECGSFATVFGSLTAFLQSGGRLLRTAPGKTKAIVIDHGGNWHRHGSLNEDRIWELGQSNYLTVGKRVEAMREQREPEPIVCPECKRPRYRGRRCPYCGHEAHKHSRQVVQIDGTLKAVDGPIHKPRRRRRKCNTAYLWEQMYYRAKSKKWNATFRQAEALFAHEQHYWPPLDLPFMPVDRDDTWRKVSELKPRELIANPETVGATQ